MADEHVPGWSRAIVWGGLGGAWALATLVTTLAWLWRGTQPGWLLPLMLAAEGAVALWAVTVGRKRIRILAGLLARQPLLRAGLVTGLAGLALLAVPPIRGTAPPGPDKSVAVVGAGAAGMHAAWVLQRTGAEVTVYEAAPYVGGHAYAYPFEADDGSIVPIDTGFMFGSPTSYREMKAMLALYGVGRTPSNLSLAGRVDGVEWATGMDGLEPELLRLHALADAQYDDLSLNLVPFGVWLWWHGFDETFRRTYLTPLLSVLFVTDAGLYEVSTRFMLNMLAGPTRWLDYRADAPAWVVEGGSSAYYARLTEAAGERVRTLTPVTAVRRRDDGRVDVTARGAAGFETATYDAVVFGVHADVARTLLADRSWLEDLVLGQIRYDATEIVVHTDTSAIVSEPLRRHYMYVQDETTDGGFELHSLPARSQRGGVAVVPEPVITLSPARDYEGERFRRGWRHHRQDLWHLALVLEVLEPWMQGSGNVWYAGDWVRFIGHGPAMASGMRAACRVAGDQPQPGLSEEPCMDVVMIDADPLAGTSEQTERLCGERDVFHHVVGLACHGQGAP